MPKTEHDANADASISRIRAYKSASAQLINASTWTKIVLDVESYDNLGEFATDRFTATVAGYYTITAQLFFANISNGKYIVVAIYVNGSLAARSRRVTGGSGDAAHGASDIINLAVGDYVELFCYHDDVAARDVNLGEYLSFLAAHKISE